MNEKEKGAIKKFLAYPLPRPLYCIDIVKGGTSMDEQVKIWQRVKGETPPVTEGLPGLAAGALARAALYGSSYRRTNSAAPGA